MPTTLADLNLRSLVSGDEKSIDHLAALMQTAGWSSGLRRVGMARGRRAPLWELAVAAEPAALMTFAATEQADRLTSLGYTRQTRYAVSWSPKRAALYDTLRWRERPGDLPLFWAELHDRAGLAELLELIGRDNVLNETPSELVAPTGEHEALPQLLGRALRQLRLHVADAEAFSGRNPASRDTAVLRLFHQFLYVRVAEDRRQARSPLKIRDIMASDRLNADLTRLLGDYRAAANSELFEPAGIAVAALPADSLREVLRQTVEPWEHLRLDFSVARTDLAGRLYESYLADLPADEKDSDAPRRLFSMAQTTDQRKHGATFYTPPALARLLTDRALNDWILRLRPRSPSDIRIVDPACGSGAFLIAAFDFLRSYFEDQRGRTLRASEREALLVQCIFGADVDERALGLAQVQLLEAAELHGRLPSLRNNLYLGDSLSAPPGAQASTGQIPWHEIIKQHGAFTTVLGNPPFGAQAKLPSRLSVERISDLAARYPEIKSFGQDYAYFFLALSMRVLTDDGSAGLVMPRGLLSLEQGLAARKFVADAGVSWIGDFRAARVFSDVAASVAGIVIDKNGVASTQIEAIPDSRMNPGAILDDFGHKESRTVTRSSISRKRLKALADYGWTAFRVRWSDDLRDEFTRPMQNLASDATKHERDVRTGVKTARVADFILDPSSYAAGPSGQITVGARAIPERFLPRVVYGADITPFDLRDTGKRLFLPYERDGRLSIDHEVTAELKARGGLPAHYQHGHLPTLLAPKILLRAFAREPAAVADTKALYVPVMRGVHALRFGDIPDRYLVSIAALLNSSIYQWLLRGLGSPRSDETIEITVNDVRTLPFPRLSDTELRTLYFHAEAVNNALAKEEAIDRALAVRDTRIALDSMVLDMLGVSERLRDIVGRELIRVE
jgi:hypothetical protein